MIDITSHSEEGLISAHIVKDSINIQILYSPRIHNEVRIDVCETGISIPVDMIAPLTFHLNDILRNIEEGNI